jgi:hypothetical protein|tara:strand:+ start:2121 stop:2333 length:213 start_codon:yes stop_codon:yes gene_type:complete
MINNYGKNMYHAIRTLEMEKEDDTPKGKGLLAPVRSFMKKKDTKENTPIMIVKKSFDLLSNTRSELNGKD